MARASAGFKEDSEVGVALKAGHPVYFVVFYPDPEPGQTLADITDAEAEFVRIVDLRHPQSAKPVLVGNCQGGWAVMMLAAARPDMTGPLVINGAPMSYWAGNDGDNPMRYAGGLVGGAWVSLLASDLGAGKFDGAHLVQSFENLNPANTFWEKYYHLFDDVDDEAERFLEFERWWGGFYLMNEEEIRWIVNNLFVGNKLAQGEARLGPGRYFDLKSIKQPIIVFASMGDNITPPQQAFNWISDLYSSTEEIKANGQTIVGLIHEDIGHLGIFVSGKIPDRAAARQRARAAACRAAGGRRRGRQDDFRDGRQRRARRAPRLAAITQRARRGTEAPRRARPRDLHAPMRMGRSAGRRWRRRRWNALRDSRRATRAAPTCWRSIRSTVLRTSTSTCAVGSIFSVLRASGRRGSRAAGREFLQAGPCARWRRAMPSTARATMLVLTGRAAARTASPSTARSATSCSPIAEHPRFPPTPASSRSTPPTNASGSRRCTRYV